MISKALVYLATLTLLAACASSSVSLQQGAAAQHRHVVKTIAVMPDGGFVADALGAEIYQRGVNILTASETRDLLRRLGLDASAAKTPAGLQKLRTEGVDALLLVVATGRAERPEAADVSLASTHNGQTLSRLNWKNGWGGMEGSPADWMMNKNLSKSAGEMAGPLLKGLR